MKTLTCVLAMFLLSSFARAAEPIKEVTDATFTTEVLESDKPVLIAFTATWDGGTKQMSEHLKQLATEAAGKVLVVRLDIDANPETPAKLGVRKVPAYVVFQAGNESARQIGAVPYEKLRSLVAQWLQ